MEQPRDPRDLADAEMEARLEELIEKLAARAPAEDITDADIDHEVQAVRGTSRPS